MKLHVTVTLSCEIDVDPADFAEELEDGQSLSDFIKESFENGGSCDLLDTLSYEGYSVDQISVKEAIPPAHETVKGWADGLKKLIDAK